ncbi:MAG: AEC family transporter [Cyanobacteria bacterium]|nr:AEC family transporter [Cyanobacteriota bacterium]MDW8202850.1 AEC family transporter [Cyanobacteriota bacterium SKYGB_h_bin112]
MIASALLPLYLKLLAGVLVGVWLGKSLPTITADYLGQALFWVGVPISILAFLRKADLSGSVWIAPAVGWVAILSGMSIAWMWLQWQQQQTKLILPLPTQGSFLLAAMVGNTGYIGYPVSLSLTGEQYFAWAMFYDLVSTTLGAYGLGAALASRLGNVSWAMEGSQSQVRWLTQALLYNPALWSFVIGYGFRSLPLPNKLEQSLTIIAWLSVALSLVLTGMRLSALTSWTHIKPATASILIKMVIVPLAIGLALSMTGLTGTPRLVIVLQAGMPPAFATLVLSEAYRLDQGLTVTAIALGAIALFITLPVWLWLFH